MINTNFTQDEMESALRELGYSIYYIVYDEYNHDTRENEPIRLTLTTRAYNRTELEEMAQELSRYELVQRFGIHNTFYKLLKTSLLDLLLKNG
jgi:hypothetical protein